ncbi:hypothetical protein USDA257_c28390 [Sinorhizobium fredii USDA 257]|uniref:Uncharacterized protein n=1 Tax=Sinorhizobium fredii (strain USDA 257) TaxID=1185652 RepID=I3X6A4_SINF2|nr:hypothetical protein USDA257_c28390 [Sinorhizobium fredii USDA 257]
MEAEGSVKAPDIREGRTKLGAIAGLLTNERKRTEALGSSRASTIATERKIIENPWAVSIEEPGPACVRDDHLVLSRSEATKEMSFSVVFGNKKRIDGLLWKAGEFLYAVRDPIPPGTHVIVVETHEKWGQIDVKIASAGADLANPIEVLLWMFNNGCRRQAIAFALQLRGIK